MPHNDLQYESFNSSDLAALAVYYQTHPIPSTLEAGVVIASILVSVLGTSTTLLLLGRRTATNGFRNWALLVLAAITMASVGIWGMHFIGMNMVLRPTPEVSWQIQFNAGFTVLSLFVPMLALVLAFVFVGTGPEALPVDDENTTWNDPQADPKSTRSKQFRKQIISGSFLSMRIVVGGILVGGTVALMHYSAGFSASFRREYSAYKLGLSIVLACCASTASLAIFFRFQSQWQDNWWKRLMCASVMSAGVCGMHYMGLSGTSWYVPLHETEGFSMGKKNSVVLTVAISVMSFGVCVIACIILLSDFLVTRETRKKTRRVVIASVTFDKTGRVLVNLDGMLPMAEVKTSLPLKDITEELNGRQPTFQWLYALSWDWSIINPFMSRISSRSLDSNGGKTEPENRGLSLRNRKEPGTSYASSKSAAQVSLFKDNCLETTHTLSHELGIPMSKMGHLFDSILRTGTRVMTPVTNNKDNTRFRNDEESSVYSVATPAKPQQGVMLFMVRELSGIEPDTAEGYLRRGFRFAEPRWLSPVLADRAAVPKIEIDGLLDHLKMYARRGMKACVQSGGTYLGFFAVRPSISRQGGIDCLVYSFARHQIPAYRLPDVLQITDEMRAWVASMSGRSMKEIEELCLRDVNIHLNATTGRHAEDMWIFKSSLVLAMNALTSSMIMFHNLSEKSLLSAEIIDVPSSDDDSTDTASMIIFQAAFPPPMRHGHELPGLLLPHEISGTYQKQDPMPTFTFVPYSLFTKAQMMLLRGSSARKFAKECRSDLMKRFAISPEALQASITSPSDLQNTHMSGMPAYLNHSEPFVIQEQVRHEEYDDVPDHLASRTGDIKGLPAQSIIRTVVRRESALSKMTGEYSLPSLKNTATFDETLPSSPEFDGPAAPAYSSTYAPDYFGSPLKSSKEGAQHSGFSEEISLPPSRRPHTAGNTDVSRMTNSCDTRPLTSGGVASGSRIAPFNVPAVPVLEDGPTKPLRVTRSNNPLGLPNQNPSLTALSQPPSRAFAITARLRSDDWYSRCMDGLERSPAGRELFGVDW